MGEFGGNSNNFWGNFGGNCKSTDFKAFFHSPNKKYIPPTIFYKNNKNIIKKENEFMLLFILGLFLGANLSLFLYACILAGKKSDE